MQFYRFFDTIKVTYSVAAPAKYKKRVISRPEKSRVRSPPVPRKAPLHIVVGPKQLSFDAHIFEPAGREPGRRWACQPCHLSWHALVAPPLNLPRTTRNHCTLTPLSYRHASLPVHIYKYQREHTNDSNVIDSCTQMLIDKWLHWSGSRLVLNRDCNFLENSNHP
jgi:hypothetical protein